MRWTTTQPTEPGAYWVRGHDIDHVESLVECELLGGVLCCRLPDTKTLAVSCLGSKLEWCGPLFPRD